uniref:Auxin-responsive protein n=1 Tax=Oryza meridionalis TaxID=40149 RepID=A0A0E0E6B6_9ORYZ
MISLSHQVRRNRWLDATHLAPDASPRFLLLLPAGGGAAPEPPTQAPHLSRAPDGSPHHRGFRSSSRQAAVRPAALLPSPRRAQRDPLAAGANDCRQEDVAISGLLDGTGEYTLVYEDYEGDRVLVGDVPLGLRD